MFLNARQQPLTALLKVLYVPLLLYVGRGVAAYYVFDISTIVYMSMPLFIIFLLP
jgi:hypothetical protein